jgi:multiple sugar transport system ATP-binding protein
MLELQAVTKRYGRTEALRGIDLTIRDGEFVVLLGPSGCGKSTALSLIAGLDPVTSGDILLRGTSILDQPPNRRNMAMVFQNYALYPQMTVRDNITFSLRLAKVPRPRRYQRADEIAAVLGLSDLLERRPAQLSGGQQQRVALGRALVRQPQVFLLDEPLSNLDAKLRLHMRGEVKRLHLELGVTSIYVTHDQIEAMTMADTIVLMRDGRIAATGAPVSLYDDPPDVYTADFLGSPPINLLRAELTAAGTDTAVDLGDGAIMLGRVPAGTPRDAIVGVRAEHVVVEAAAAGDAAAGKVVLVEPVGSDEFVHVAVGGHRIIARRATGAPLRLGAPVDVAFNRGRVHLFDPVSERRLARI